MLADIFTVEHLTTFLVLTALETVLGFDNLLYISIEAKQVAPERQAFVRRWGIILAIGLRIVLLFVVLQLIEAFQEPLFTVTGVPFIEGSVSGHSLIVLAGGVFLIYTALKEITHMMTLEVHEHDKAARATKSISKALFWITAMNIIFSFDTVLSAVALTDNFIVMTAAIVVSGGLMVLMADTVANFLKKNRMYEVLGLFVLLLVGMMLMSEGGHIAHLAFFGYEVETMSKATFYFILVTMVLVEIVQGRYQRKLMHEKDLTVIKAGTDSGHV
ncbi:putative tellurium resistance membrane protein TerC [Hoeflea marina]|uniref:Putative tellurium resistance membrane protein TerC n=1 Tax=Hoeflea marina TaxID=274592 RepID=A0A317PDG4_9HYPH|nr:tellurium resistance protein TerC [Hoeflea marina]PWV95270.1 putative tellurium resistance membrane protein TerC [Hoeflea marina]